MKINEKTMTIAVHTQLAIGCANNVKYCDIPGDEPKRLDGKVVIPIVHDYGNFISYLRVFKKNLYKFD